MNDKVNSAESLITHRQVTLTEVQRFYDDYGYDVGPRQSKDYTDVIVTDPRVQIAWRVSLNWRLDGDGHLVDPRNGVQYCFKELGTLIGLQKPLPQGNWNSEVYFGHFEKRVFQISLPIEATDVMIVFSSQDSNCSSRVKLTTDDVYPETEIKFQESAWVDINVKNAHPGLPRAYTVCVLPLHLEYDIVMEMLYQTTAEYCYACRNDLWSLRAAKRKC